MGHQPLLQKYFKTLLVLSNRKRNPQLPAFIYLPTQRDPQAKAMSTTHCSVDPKWEGLNSIAQG